MHNYHNIAINIAIDLHIPMCYHSNIQVIFCRKNIKKEMVKLIIIIEMIIAILTITGILIGLCKRSPKKVIIFSILTIIILFIAIFLTLALENPKMEVNEIIQIEVSSIDEIKPPKTTYMYRDVTNNVEISGNIEYKKIGEYEIEYAVPMLFKTYTQKQIIKIVDTTPPEITLEGGEVITQSNRIKYQELGFKAIDNYDGDITGSVTTEESKIDENTLEIIYTVSDSSGNTSVKKRTVNLVDDNPPTITLNGTPKIAIVVGNEYKEQGAKAKDDKDGDLTKNIKIEGTVDTSKIGEYTITYKVTDKSGNIATKTRTVVVTNEPAKAKQGTDGEKGVIYLTFDDGPTTTITPQILDILKKKNVKATFFILNYSDAGEQVVKREVEEGHTVAIHGYSHNYNTIYRSVDAYMQNITMLQNRIKNSTGYNATITRFPGGSSNTVSKFNPGIMTILTKEVVDRGYKYFDWNVSSGDAGGAKTSEDVYNNVTKNLSKSRMNVVLMHDFNGNTKTLNALEAIIDYGIENGYTFARITEDTPMVTHRVNN